MFFEGSVKGLNVGSPVVFRGVKIGEVTNVKLIFDPQKFSALIAVYAEVDPESFTVSVPGEEKSVLEKARRGALLKPLVEKGLKAQLQTQSYVTGQLIINVDFYPDKPIRLVGLEKKYNEVPTIPTSMAELEKSIETLPLKEIGEHLNNSLGGIDKIVNSPELSGSISAAHQALRSADKLVKDVDAEIKPLASDIHNVSASAVAALDQAKKTLALNEGVPGQMAASFDETLKVLRGTLEETKKAVAEMAKVAGQNPNLGYELHKTLEQVTALSRSIRVLVDYLEQHPDSLVKGKKSAKGE
jgi:paraquat-inducible protein B